MYKLGQSTDLAESFLASKMTADTLSVHGVHEIKIYQMFEIYSKL